MTRLHLGTTGASLGDRVAAYDGALPDAAWRAALAVCADASPDRLELAADPDVLALWDQETLGVPRPAFTGDGRTARERLAWLAEHEPHTWALLEEGQYAVGGLESYLAARLTRGTWHVTDPTHAAATGLAASGAPADALPEEVATGAAFATTDAASFLGLAVPVAIGPVSPPAG